jgi:hypothetical protein
LPLLFKPTDLLFPASLAASVKSAKKGGKFVPASVRYPAVLLHAYGQEHQLIAADVMPGMN